MQSALSHLLLLSSTLSCGLTGELVAAWSPSKAGLTGHAVSEVVTLRLLSVSNSLKRCFNSNLLQHFM